MYWLLDVEGDEVGLSEAFNYLSTSTPTTTHHQRMIDYHHRDDIRVITELRGSSNEVITNVDND